MVIGVDGLRGAPAVRPVVKVIRQDPGCAMTLPLSLVVIYVKGFLSRFRCAEAKGPNARKVVEDHELGKLYPIRRKD